MRTLLVTGVCIAASLTVSSAQKDHPQADYYTNVNYVEVAVRVLDRDGEFVRGLTAADFSVRENGRPQEVTSFSLVDAAGPGAGEGRDGRVYAFVIDDLFLGPEHLPRVRNIVRGFLESRLADNDVAAIGLASGTVLQNYTADRQALIARIEELRNIFGPSEHAAQSIVWSRRLRGAVHQVASGLGEIRGRRKALVLISPSAICEVVTDISRRVREDGHVVSCGALFDTAVRAGVSIYAIDPRGPVVPSYAMAESRGDERGLFNGTRAGWITRLTGARTLAEETGGFAVTSTNNFEMYLDRLVAENTTYYLIGYYSTNPRPDGKFREHDVAVNRPDARVSHRPGYVAATSAAQSRRR